MADNKKTSIQKNDHDEFDATRMSFGDHLMELRSRLIKSILSLVAAFIVCLFFGKHIITFITVPLLIALDASGQDPSLYYNSPPESFLTYIKVSLYCGVFVAAPLIFHQMWGFIAAGLYKHERKFVNVFAPFSALLFILGGVFFITIVAPISFNFFMTFGSNWVAPDYHDSFLYKIFKSENAQQGIDVDGGEDPCSIPVESVSGEEVFSSPSLITINLFADAKEYEASPEPAKIVPAARIALNIPIPLGQFWASPALNALTGTLSDIPVELDEAGQVTINGESKGSTEESAVSDDSEQKGTLAKPLITLEKYISFVIWLSLVFGLAFQMPLIVFVLGRMGLVSLEVFKKVRKFVILAIVVMAAVLTPPDVVSQTALAIPMYALYELGILMLTFWPKKKSTEIVEQA